MKQKKLLIILIAISLLTTAIFLPITYATPNPCTVSGYIYLNDVIIEPDQIKLILPGQTVIGAHFDTGFYIVDFAEEPGTTGYFEITNNGKTYQSEETITTQFDIYEYNIDLHFYTLLNNAPDKPELVSPADNSEDIEINPVLTVTVIDPDADTMNVSFYNASDDSLIGTDTNVANGSTASISWSDLSYNTTYYWYAVANDSQFETKSDTWSFTTNEEENENPNVCIVKPQRAIYILNKKILPRFFGMALIIGDITIEVNATDVDSGIEKVEFYINGKLKGNDTTEPYTYNWTRDRLRLVHIFFIKVVAYDNDGATAKDCTIVRKFL